MTTRKKKADDYEVGYGKPPKDTQFKPGQSGNRKGRPKGAKNLQTLVREVLSEKVTIGGKPVSKHRALIMRLSTDALNGKASAQKQMLELIAQFEMLNDSTKDVLSEVMDEKAMERAARRFAERFKSEEGGEAGKVANENEKPAPSIDSSEDDEDEDWLK